MPSAMPKRVYIDASNNAAVAVVVLEVPQQPEYAETFRRSECRLSQLYLGIAGGMSIAQVWARRYSK